jgi:hypothetical protein
MFQKSGKIHHEHRAVSICSSAALQYDTEQIITDRMSN